MKAIINGKEVRVEIIDKNYNDTMSEVKILEGTFAGKYTTVSKEDVLTETKKTKSSARIEKSGRGREEDFENNCTHFTDDSVYYYITVKSNTKNEAENIFEDIAYRLVSELSDYNVELSCCPYSDEYDDYFQYGDALIVPFEYGSMKEIHKDIMREWKAIKKELGVK